MMVMDNPAKELNGEVTGRVVTTKKREVDAGLWFVLSENLPISPAKLVKKILKGTVVDGTTSQR